MLGFEPNLNLMILTKENVAGQAFAEHIEGLNMPQCITSKIGRLVGHMELKKNRTKGTNRHEVLRQKKLLIGCEVVSSKSALNLTLWLLDGLLKLPKLSDESQQYGNIEETSVIARTFHACLNIWTGDIGNLLVVLRTQLSAGYFVFFGSVLLGSSSRQSALQSAK